MRVRRWTQRGPDGSLWTTDDVEKFRARFLEAGSDLLHAPTVFDVETEGLDMIENPNSTTDVEFFPGLVIERWETVEWVPRSETSGGAGMVDEILFYCFQLRAGEGGMPLMFRRYVDSRSLGEADFGARYRVLYDGEAFDADGAWRCFTDQVGQRLIGLFKDAR